MRMEFTEDNAIAGLDPDGLCLARLSARSALYTDLQVLLQARTELLPASDYWRAVVDENALSRGSVAARRKVFKELKGRCVLDGHPLCDREADSATNWREPGGCGRNENTL
jgi:hypothetical protein